jgi:streptomycin 6-kinase
VIRVPEAFAGWTQLPDLVDALTAGWSLIVEDPRPRHGALAVVLLVRRDGEPCALRLNRHPAGTGLESLALRTWDGHGAVRLLRDDPALGAQLLERVDPDRSARTLPPDQAAEVAGGLLRELTVPAPAGLPALASIAGTLAGELPGRQRALGHPVPPSWLARAVSLAAELAGADAGDFLVHSDLRADNILAADRVPWLAIDPRPVAGRPEFSVPELLWSRVDDLPTDAAVHRHLDRLIGAAGLAPEVALAWTAVRCVDYWLWGLANGLTEDPRRCRRILAALAG